MQIDVIDWDNEDDPTGNVQHIAEHGINPAEVEEILESPEARDGTSRSSGRPTRYGWTSVGRWVVVVYEVLCGDPLIIRPITAYETDKD